MKTQLINKGIVGILTLLLGALMSSYISSHSSSSALVQTHAAEPSPYVRSVFDKMAIVAEVIDGDTLRLNTGEKVRLIGMDTPEIHHPKKPVQCFGEEAKNITKNLVEGKSVRLEKDVSNKDKYGRLLRFVYVENSAKTNLASGEIFLNEYLLKEGYARILTVPPDVSMVELFRTLQNQAMHNKKGLWKACK